MTATFYDSREMLDAALALASQGFQVFPCVYATKEPTKGSRGFYGATANAAVIRRWFGGSMQRNLAVRTGAASGCWVLDVDDPGALAEIEARHGVLPVTRMSRTSRGHHYWWELGGTPVPCSAGRIAPHIDVRGDGGYVMAPPSVHVTGVVYEWTNDAPLVKAPGWLVERAVMRPPREMPPPSKTHHAASGGRVAGAYAKAAIESEIAVLASTPAGARNHQLNRSSFSLYQLVAGGVLDHGEVEHALIEAAKANGLMDDPHDGPAKVMATIHSGARAGLQHPRSPNGGR